MPDIGDALPAREGSMTADIDGLLRGREEPAPRGLHVSRSILANAIRLAWLLDVDLALLPRERL